MVVLKFENPIEFHIKEALTHGVCNGKYGGYTVPLYLEPDGEFLKLLRSTADEHSAELKLYGVNESTLYIRCDQLSKKQKDELLGEGCMSINIRFAITGTYTGKAKGKKDGANVLSFELLGMRKVRVAEKILRPAPSDDC